MMISSRAWALMTMVLASACGGKGTARLQFSNSAAAPNTVRITAQQAQALGFTAASSFKMKLIAAYLAEDMDPVTQNNVGNTSMFWLNSDCSDDIMSCTTDPTTNGGKDEQGNTWRHTVSSFFDFSNVATVNTTLNSQGREIDTGTYKYVRLEFCKWQGTDSNYDNIKWSYNGTEHSFAQSSCNVTAAISPPIEVKSGDTVTITLAYSLDGTLVASGGSTASNCADGYCFTLPAFSPSASK